MISFFHGQEIEGKRVGLMEIWRSKASHGPTGRLRTADSGENGAWHAVPFEGSQGDYAYEIEHSSSLFQFIGLVMMYS